MLTFFVLGPITELNNTFNDSPGQESCSTPALMYGEYIVSPLKPFINELLLDNITVDVLPYLSDKTTPT